MNAVFLNFIILGIQTLLREAPGAITGLRALFAVENPTDADFEAAKARIRADTFEKLVPNAEKFPKPQ